MSEAQHEEGQAQPAAEDPPPPAEGLAEAAADDDAPPVEDPPA